MKRQLLVVFGLLGSLVLVRPVMANEGVFHLAPVDGGAGACFAVSVFADGSYRILMTCRDLKMAVDPEQNKYVTWTESGTKRKRVGEVINGKFQGRNDDKFDRLLITLEKDASTTKQNGRLVLSGAVESIDFGRGVSAQTTITAQPTPTPTKVVKTTTTTTDTTAKSSGVGTFLGTLLKIALLGFGLLIVVVGVFGFMSRRKKL